MRRIVAVTLAASLALAAFPVLAQEDAAASAGGERVNQIIVYGDDPCPASIGDEITVCARKAESERYRIPAPLRETPSSRAEAWNERVLAYETVGSIGTSSCSAVGPGGVTGCLQRLLKNAYAEKGAADVQFSQLIEEERQKRLSTVDAESAAMQARVEQVEKTYEARQRAEQEAAAPVAPPTTP